MTVNPGTLGAQVVVSRGQASQIIERAVASYVISQEDFDARGISLGREHCRRVFVRRV